MTSLLSQSNAGVRAPEFPSNLMWLNSKPLTLASLLGKVVLIDFWTYSCVNCLRTLPSLREWHKRYASKGLVIVGVHAPEFDFEKVGANVQVVAKAMGLDKRIGSKFLHAGPGFGGSCFPKDVRALMQIGESHGYDFKIARSVIEVNITQKNHMITKIEHALRGAGGKTLGVLGLAFKPNTNDIRESPAIHIIEGLIDIGASVRVYDPAAMDDAKAVLGNKVTYCNDAYDVANNADAIILVTEWNQFRNLQLDRLKGLLKHPVFIDLRNVYEPDRMRKNGFDYYSVGRS